MTDLPTIHNHPNDSASSCDSISLLRRQVNVSVSYLEIYNESVNDLLDANKKNLDVREHKGEVFVDQLTSKKVGSAGELLSYLAEGEHIRQIAETRINIKSSRSHTVFRVNIEVED